MPSANFIFEFSIEFTKTYFSTIQISYFPLTVAGSALFCLESTNLACHNLSVNIDKTNQTFHSRPQNSADLLLAVDWRTMH